MSMPGALDFLVSEYPPPPPHSDAYGRHLLDASLTAADAGGGGGAGEGADTDNYHTAFEDECERLRPDPPTAPVGEIVFACRCVPVCAVCACVCVLCRPPSPAPRSFVVVVVDIVYMCVRVSYY